jgi:hypothetical protein
MARRVLGLTERIFDVASRAGCKLGLSLPTLASLLTRLPLAGAVGGSAVGRAPEVCCLEFNIGSSMSRAPGVTRIVVGEGGGGAPASVGEIVKRKLFPDCPDFVFNVSFSCGRASRSGLGVYADPRSIWFNVFFGYYEIIAPKSSWARPFGYEVEKGKAQVCFDDIVRLGKADWNYFSNYIYGVPLSDIEPYDQINMDEVGCIQHGRDRVGGGERYWDIVELDGVEVVSAYVSGRDGKRLQSPSRVLSPLWRLAFGSSAASPTHQDSFIPTRMRARLNISYLEDEDSRLGKVYRTLIFGGTTNSGYPDKAANEFLLKLQMQALHEIIGRYYHHLGFASGDTGVPDYSNHTIGSDNAGSTA